MQVKEEEIREAEILVVDDSMTALKNMENILTSYEFEHVRTCQNPIQSLDEFDELEPALVILDYDMPKMNGKDVLEKLLENHAEEKVNVLFWTALSDKSLVTDVLNKGAGDVLSKGDISEEEIICRVRNQIETHLYDRKLDEHNKELNRKVEKRARELEQASRETIQRLVKAAEFRDNETAGHIERIGLLTEKLAELMDLDESICSAIRYGAPMHDIGKMGVPDEILFKPDSLNEDEWDEMKKHSVYGAKILSGSNREYLKMAKKIAHYHHEHWNGNGYPEGLSGTDIPLEARITAVCDVFDAVLSERPYKDPWPIEKALDLVREEIGQQFDPDIAQCFLNNADEMIAIRENYSTDDDHNELEPKTTAAAS